MAAVTDEKRDLEAAFETSKDESSEYVHDGSSVEEVKRAHDLQKRVKVFKVLREGEEWLDRKMGVELQGIDRIPEEKKTPPSIWNVSCI
jgi:hypothetical protein